MTLLKPPSPQRKSLRIFSILNLTFLGMLNRDIRYMSRLDKVLQVKVSLPPFEIYCLFQNACLLRNLSFLLSQTASHVAIGVIFNFSAKDSLNGGNILLFSVNRPLITAPLLEKRSDHSKTMEFPSKNGTSPMETSTFKEYQNKPLLLHKAN